MRVCVDLLCHPTPCTIVKGVGVVGPGYKTDWLETQSLRRNNGKPKWPSNGVIEKPISRTMLLAQSSNGGSSSALAIDSATDILPRMTPFQSIPDLSGTIVRAPPGDPVNAGRRVH
ncbi:hypothetical protein CBL_13820 [Carabus blaptoides fortunei]